VRSKTHSSTKFFEGLRLLFEFTPHPIKHFANNLLTISDLPQEIKDRYLSKEKARIRLRDGIKKTSKSTKRNRTISGNELDQKECNSDPASPTRDDDPPSRYAFSPSSRDDDDPPSRDASPTRDDNPPLLLLHENAPEVRILTSYHHL